jgi:hypothetical protein
MLERYLLVLQVAASTKYSTRSTTKPTQSFLLVAVAPTKNRFRTKTAKIPRDNKDALMCEMFRSVPGRGGIETNSLSTCTTFARPDVD